MWPDVPEPLTPPVIRAYQCREDFAQQHVLLCFQKLGRKRRGPMFIVSQLNFVNYLDKYGVECVTHRIDPEVGQLLPTISQLPDDYKRGDFDILIICPKHGVLIGEIKAVGHSDVELEKLDENIANRIKTAVKQLDKGAEVMRHIAKDMFENLRVRTTLIVPYVSRSRLHTVLQSRPDLAEKLRNSLGIDTNDLGTVVDLCMCADDLSDRKAPWDVSEDVLDRLEKWWDRRMPVDPMPDDAYKRLVARLCGPASTVRVHSVVSPRLEVKTLGQTVSEAGRRFSLLALTQEQLNLLTRAPARICLTGPPGTGKTIVLVIRGLMAVREEGSEVVVLSTTPFSLAVSKLIHQQLTMTLEGADEAHLAKRAHFVECDLRDHSDSESVEAVVDQLEGILEGGVMRQDDPQCVEMRVPGRKLCVLMDEADFYEDKVGPATQELVRELAGRFQDRLVLWAACMPNSEIPQELEVEKLAQPLRCCPVVCREIQEKIANISNVDNYADAGIPSHTDGVKPIEIQHSHDRDSGHTGEWPIDCECCGRLLAEILKDQLKVGVPLQETDTASPVSPSASSQRTITPLNPQYRDVFVLTRSKDLHEEHPSEKRPASGLVRGLRAGGLPVGVLGWRRDNLVRWQEQLDDLAVAKTDQVTVARWRAVDGLERKIVVYVPGRDLSVDSAHTDEQVAQNDHLHLVSRCSTQLIKILMP